MSMSSDLAGQRQRLKTTMKAVEKAKANAANSKQETIEEAVLAAAWAAVVSVAGLIPDIKSLDGKLSHGPKTLDDRKGDRLAQEIATGKLHGDEKKKNKLKQIEGKIDKSDQLARKFADRKSELTKAAKKLKQKNGVATSIEAMFADLASKGADLADIGAGLAAAMGAAASKSKDGAIDRFMTVLKRKLVEIDRGVTKVTMEVKKKGG